MTALHTHSKRSEITAVELSPAVISAAQRYFYLPQGKRVQLHCGDAGAFVAAQPGRYDLIFSDLYTAAGVAPLQLQADFLADCAACLKTEGVLAINGWRANQDTLQTALAGVFPQLRFCPISDGNTVLLASQHILTPSAAELKAQAQHWSRILGFDLTSHLKRLETASTEPFKR